MTTLNQWKAKFLTLLNPTEITVEFVCLEKYFERLLGYVIVGTSGIWLSHAFQHSLIHISPKSCQSIF